MKIKLLKDIPGYKTGEEANPMGSDLSHGGYRYVVHQLIDDGFAEEIKDDIDIEEIRNTYLIGLPKHLTAGFNIEVSEEEAKFFTSYRIVKAVIEKLNGDWKLEWKKVNYNNCAKIIRFKHDDGIFQADWFNQRTQTSILPYAKSIEIGNKVIELCEPELRVLFSVDKKV